MPLSGCIFSSSSLHLLYFPYFDIDFNLFLSALVIDKQEYTSGLRPAAGEPLHVSLIFHSDRAIFWGRFNILKLNIAMWLLYGWRLMRNVLYMWQSSFIPYTYMIKNVLWHLVLMFPLRSATICEFACHSITLLWMKIVTHTHTHTRT